MAELRPYQRKTIDQLWLWFEYHAQGNPCIVLPTGSGKSHVIAEICRESVQSWPETRILLLTHQKELIEQDAEKLLQHWPFAPLGIYSAGIGRREMDRITFASIQSIHRRADEVGYIDLVIIDEAHLVSHKDQGMYRTFLEALRQANPQLRVVGLTATPWRLGHGLITDGDALFDDVIEVTSIAQLQRQGYLSMLRSKVTKKRLSVEGVHIRGGEYIESELQKAVDKREDSELVVDEVIARAGSRKAWLFFCTGVEHARHVSDILVEHGVTAACVTGETPKAEREAILDAFKQGEIKALTNANVLTTGFDYPDIDLIVMMRPTMSPVLYLQMAGRGLRLKSDGGDCLVLDFAGVVAMHGPITQVKPPRKKGERQGVAPSKVCPQCEEIIGAGAKTCPSCGYEFPQEEHKADWYLRDDDISGLENIVMQVRSWQWRLHIGKSSGKQSLEITYYGALSDPPIREYLVVFHPGYAGEWAMSQLRDIAEQAGVDIMAQETPEALCEAMEAGRPPSEIEFRKNGKFYRVKQRIWKEEKEDGTDKSRSYFSQDEIYDGIGPGPFFL
ncbi:MAG: DEAD/DEAH box helicase [Spirochaetia bacterium]|nr:DEAD/DEAH box helicase [Spirochaetia bacterium]